MTQSDSTGSGSTTCANTYATDLARAGVNVALIQRQLRHANLSTTRGYVDALDASNTQQRLGAALAALGGESMMTDAHITRLEDALCKTCKGSGFTLEFEPCPACDGRGYIMEGCCDEGEPEHEHEQHDED